MPDQLARVFAFPIFPGRTPAGGSVPATQELADALENAYQAAKVDRGLSVAFVFDANTRARQNEARAAIMAVAFGRDQDAEAAAITLATRLANAMDLRSKPALLVITAHGLAHTREVVLWIFPKEEAFRYSTDSHGERIELLDDIFSRSSYLRKAAAFSGRNLRTSFLGGRVVDFQANATDRYVADFWVERFLEARLQMSGDEGTVLFAKAIKKTFDSLDGDVVAQEQLAAAVTLVRRQPRRLSLRSFAELFLDKPVADLLLKNAPNPEAVDALFDFEPARFEQVLRFQVFHLDNGAIVTAPLETVAQAVTITEDGGNRILQTRGKIVRETMKARRG